MAHYTRQTLAAYGFFEEARRTNKFTQDALIPFVLPAIAGKAGQIFSAEDLAKELEPIFGPGLVIHLADSLAEPLARAGYLKREVGGPGGSLYLYDQKTNEIPLSASVSRAEQDIDTITTALRDYINVTPSLKPILKTDSEIANEFVNWITSTDTSQLRETISQKEFSPSSAGAQKSNWRPELIFSSFVTWAAKDRPYLFDKIKLFAELGLVIDLLSEMRVPTIKRKRIDLSVVLDSTVILEMLGLCGPMLQTSAKRLMEMCKEYKIGVWTLSHLVDEVNEICYNVINNPIESFTGSVNDSVKRYPEVMELVRKVNKNPDTCIKALGINITPYSNITDAKSIRFFDSKDIQAFTEFLHYDKSKPMMAKRDAWSLAYSVRRQNGVHTSNLYESKCVVVTRSPVFAAKAREYLRSETGLYPNYAVTPVIELRHFSTMFMLAFGSDVADKIVRAELVASCDRIVRASPGLIQKIRTILERMNTFTHAQLDTVMSDPATVAEFTLATGNDPSLVTPQSGEALLEIIRSATAKEERLKSLEREREQKAQHRRELDEKQAEAQKAEQAAEQARQDAKRQAMETDRMTTKANQSADLAASVLADGIVREVRNYWVAVLVLGILAGIGLGMDMFWDYTHLGQKGRIAILVPVAAFVFYHSLAFVWPDIEPAAVRAWVTRKVAGRRLAKVTEDDVRTRVWERLPIPHKSGSIHR